MQRFIMLLGILYSCIGWTTPVDYQIDLIIFIHAGNLNNELPIDIPIIPTTSNAILLKPDTTKSQKNYLLLSNSLSSLSDEYYQLSHRSNYQVIGYYSWRQPANNRRSVALPLTEQKGWQMEGILRIRQSGYYKFHAELQVSPPNNPQSSFTVSQRQRLKDNIVYYLDNEQVGIVVKIHPVT